MSLRLNLEETQEHLFRELAMKKFGYRKGAISQALTEAIRLWISRQEAALPHPSAPVIKSAQEILFLLKQHLPYLQQQYHVARIGLFGSYVRNEAKPSSDVDLLVEFEDTPGLLTFIEIKEYLTNVLGIKVDLVSKSNLKSEIKDQILSETIYA